jgi:hypothetical protein
MEPSFFQVNQRSRCFFTPDSWCDLFDSTSPVGPLEFLCNTTAQRVAVVLPSPPGEAGRLWDSVFSRIAAVWEDRRIGFRCERVNAEAWTSQQPCPACTLVRTAQVVILDVQPGNQRAASFRDLAISAFGMLKGYKEAFQADRLPRRKIICMHCGPALLPPHYATLFDVLDYADAQGRPDLDKLQQQMAAIAHSATLFDAAPAISIHFDNPPAADDKPAVSDTPVAPPGVDIRILGESAAPVEEPAAPAAMGVVVREVRDRLKFLDTLSNPVSGRYEYKAVTEALALIKESRFIEAIHVLNAASDGDEPEIRSARKGMVMECLDNITPAEIVTEFFASDPMLKTSLSLSTWNNARLMGSTVGIASLSVWASDLRNMLGARVNVWLLDELQADEVKTLGQELKAAGGGAALLVSARSSAQVFPVGVLVAQFREDTPAAHLIELRLDDLKRQISDRAQVLDYLRLQVEEHLLDVAQLYRKSSERLVFKDNEFFGREELIDSLIRHFVDGNSFAVFGLRRSGKSSLLHRLELINKLDDHLIALIDLTIPPDSADELYYRVATGIRTTVESKYPPAIYPKSVFPTLDVKRLDLFRLDPESSAGTFRNCFVKDLGELLSGLAASKIKFQKLILLFDELEKIIPDEITENRGIDEYRHFLAQLRALLNHPRLMVGMVGYGPLLEQEFRDHDGPLYSQLQLLPLGMLTREECSKMVRSLGGARVDWTDASLEAVFHATGGDPRFTKYLCAEILSVRPRPNRGRGVGITEVQLGVDSLLTSVDMRQRLLRQLTAFARFYPGEAGLVEQIASEAVPDAGVDIGWEDGRRRLIDYALIEARGRSARLRCGLLHRVLRERMSIPVGRRT